MQLTLPVPGIVAWLGFAASTEVRLIIITVVAVALAWTGLLLWDRYRKQAALTAADPRGLYENLCAVHHLSDAERGALNRLVASRQLPQPAVVFVDPRILRDAASHHDPECEGLLRRLFGEIGGA